MYEIGMLRPSAEVLGPLQKFRAVGMSAKAVNSFDLRPKPVLIAKYFDLGLLFYETTAEGVGRLPTNN